MKGPADKVSESAQDLERALAKALDGGQTVEAAHLCFRLDRRSQAASLFEHASSYLEAAHAWQAAGSAPRALAAVTKVNHAHPHYRSACRMAIDLAAALRVTNHELDTLLESYLRQGPADPDDVTSFFMLGQHFERHHFDAAARRVYEKLLAAEPDHGPARQALRDMAPRLDVQATSEMAISKADVKAVRDLVKRADETGETQVASAFSNPPSSSLRAALGVGVAMLGEVIADRYRLDRALGRGSTAQVFQARDLKLDEDVALKVFDQRAKEGEQEARFKRELSLARKLAHPNVVRLYDLAEHRGQRLLVMELLKGCDLTRHLAATPVDDAGRLDLLIQLCAGLGYAHEQGVVHRDIKPDNLFVTTDGVLKVADFGIAKGCGDPSITASGIMGGTPYYISPEQITDFRRVDHRTDLYAFGVVAYELMARQRPFEERDLMKLLGMHMDEAPRPMRNLRPDLPEELDRIVLTLLQKEREARFQTCGELAKALQAVRAGL